MPPGPGKLSQFWQELKRRKVLKAIAMYAGGAFVLFDLANNVVAPLNLPDWTPRLVIIIALVGFPIMVVWSWIFDFTPEGIGKTVSLEELSVQEQAPLPGKRKLKVSDVIILVLLVVVGILLYPRVFGAGSLNAMTFPVTVVNEFGEKETRRVFKDEYISRLALFPFNNEANDSSLRWLEYGIMDAIKEDQYQFSNIVVEYNDATLLNVQLANARDLNYPFFLSGDFKVSNGLFEITTRLYQTANGAIMAEHIYRGTNFFNLVDSICIQLRSDMEISEVILNSTPDLSISDLLTDNLKAYGHYIKGRYYWVYDNEPYFPLVKAIELDSTFAQASYRLANFCYMFQASSESAINSISQAIRHRHRLSETRDIKTRILNYLIHEDEERVIRLLELQYKLKPQDFNLLSTMETTYWMLNLVERWEDVTVRMNELVPDHHPYQISLGDCYLHSSKPDNSLDLLNELLKDNPEHVQALLKKGEAYLHKNNLVAAEEVIIQAIVLNPENEGHLTKLLDHIVYMKETKDIEEVLESVEGTYRADNAKWNMEFNAWPNQLYFKPDNQGGGFIYPVSDSVFVLAFKEADIFNFLSITFIRNSQGLMKQLKFEQWSNSNYVTALQWKEDELILDAKEFLTNGQEMEALQAFRKAYDQNPEHYYLVNYIHHLEFVLSPEYELAESAFNSYVGQYGDMEFQLRDGWIFYKDNRGLIFRLLPLSEDTFMVPSKYNLQIQMLKTNRVVTGLKVVSRNGDEELHAASSSTVATLADVN